MKNIIALIFISNLLIFSSDVCDIKKIKGFEFGTSKEEALKNKEVEFKFSSYQEMANAFSVSIEELKKTEQDTGLCLMCIFSTSFAGYPAEGNVAFSEKGLYSFTSTFNIETSNKTKYIDAYFKLKNLLTKKYGAPDEIEYLEYPYEDDFPRGDHAGTALSVGKGEYWSAFSCKDDENIYINLKLTGDNYKLSLGLAYVNRNFDKDQETKLQESLDEF